MCSGVVDVRCLSHVWNKTRQRSCLLSVAPNWPTVLAALCAGTIEIRELAKYWPVEQLPEQRLRLIRASHVYTRGMCVCMLVFFLSPLSVCCDKDGRGNFPGPKWREAHFKELRLRLHELSIKSSVPSPLTFWGKKALIRWPVAWFPHHSGEKDNSIQISNSSIYFPCSRLVVLQLVNLERQKKKLTPSNTEPKSWHIYHFKWINHLSLLKPTKNDLIFIKCPHFKALKVNWIINSLVKFSKVLTLNRVCIYYNIFYIFTLLELKMKYLNWTSFDTKSKK